MAIKKIITASISTIIFVIESALAPFFWVWYKAQFPEDFIPASFGMIMFLITLAQFVLICYLWFRVFDKNSN